MLKASKRKVAVTQKLSGPSSSSTPQSSRTVIRSFHTLLKQQARLQAQPSTSENAKLLNDISQELDSLGGLETYQQMSAIGQGNDRGGGSEKVFISWLKELQWPDLKGKGKHRLLEVGALKPDNYDHCRAWLEVIPIDLHSRHPQIMEQDFLKMDVTENAEKWDAISLSLVVNFVPVAKNRGRMLTLAHTMLAVDGLLFLALPLPCVMNSRYTTPEHISSLMARVGFEKLRERWKSGGKMIYWLFRKADPMHGAEGYQRKSVLRRGNRNNFAILL